MRTRSSEPEPPARLYRAVLHLYPHSFRSEYGDEMLRCYRDLVRERPGARLWLRIARDTLVAVPRIRVQEGIMRTSGVAIVLAVAAVVSLVSVGTGSIPIAAGMTFGIVGVVAGLAAIVARASGSAEHLYGSGRWNWWTVLAVALAGFFVFFGIGQLVDDPKATNVGALGASVGFAGAIAVGLVLRRRGRRAGGWLIAIGAAPGLMSIWFWPLLAASLLVIVGSIAEMMRATRDRPLNYGI